VGVAGSRTVAGGSEPRWQCSGRYSRQEVQVVQAVNQPHARHANINQSVQQGTKNPNPGSGVKKESREYGGIGSGIDPNQ